MKILVINSGSSSVKAQLIEMDNNEVLANAYCERVGIDGSFMTYKKNGEKLTLEKPMPSHKEAFQFVLDTLVDKDLGVISSLDEIKAVGHRMVNFGEWCNKSMVITPEVFAEMKKNLGFAPLHNPPAVLGAEICMSLMPNVKHVAVFDVAFHSTMPEKAFMYAIPYEFYENNKIRRYGAHGTSHRYIAKQVKDIYGDLNGKKIISCHLGSGSSICAIKDGKCVDTTMGFTPLAGLVMGTRCGDIDASIVAEIMKITGKNVDDVISLLNKQSGLSGITGGMSDMRDIESNLDNPRIKLAFDMLVYSIKKYIGAYAAAMNGVDYLVFTAGIGEKSDLVRSAVCKDMDYLGIELDEDKNKNLNKPFGEVVELQSENSKVKIVRIPTDEEWMIAQDTKELSE